ncbi:hypothetical protein BKA62DRAFT_718901 [Auriculariales sp. MPI-PUGE-AT-0066]|nr:hypothetical protein BKA62DRAFT_718901 [Auriculariales sp. MPI-PUGE-AT-0066]
MVSNEIHPDFSPPAEMAGIAVLKSSDDVLFYLPISHLALSSTVLADMFDVGNPATACEPTSSTQAMSLMTLPSAEPIGLAEASSDLEILFALIMQRVDALDKITTAEVAVSLFHLANLKYGIPVMAYLFRAVVRDKLPSVTSPLFRYAYAKECGLHTEAKLALQSCCEVPFHFDKHTGVAAERVLEVLEERQRRIDTFKDRIILRIADTALSKRLEARGAAPNLVWWGSVAVQLCGTCAIQHRSRIIVSTHDTFRETVHNFERLLLFQYITTPSIATVMESAVVRPFPKTLQAYVCSGRPAFPPEVFDTFVRELEDPYSL